MAQARALAKAECRGVLDKMASQRTLTVASYSFVVWQERYVWLDDDALCYHKVIR